MIETKITLTIKHARPLPDLCDLVAGRAYTLSHVEDVTAEVVGQDKSIKNGPHVVDWYSEELPPSTKRCAAPQQAEASAPTHVFVPVELLYRVLDSEKLNAMADASDELRAMLKEAPQPHQPPNPSPNEWVLE